MHYSIWNRVNISAKNWCGSVLHREVNQAQESHSEMTNFNNKVRKVDTITILTHLTFLTLGTLVYFGNFNLATKKTI